MRRQMGFDLIAERGQIVSHLDGEGAGRLRSI